MGFLLPAQCACATGTGAFVERGMQPLLGKPFADTPDRTLAGMQRSGDLRVRLLLAGVQENLGAIDHPRAGRTTVDRCVQLLSLVVGEYHCVDLFPHRRLLRDAVSLPQNERCVKITVAED